MYHNIIEARDVHKTYFVGEVEVLALRGVDLLIERGQMISIMGPSGCGKTTLLNCLAGLDDIDQGEIIIDGEVLHDLPDYRRADLRALKMGFIFQFFNLLDVLDAVENVELPLLVAGMSSREARGRAENSLEQVGLADRMRHRPSELSGGQQQRVAIARALANDPVVVWADEPTGNLDSDMGQEVMDLLTHLNQEHDQTFVIVTHDPAVSARTHAVVRMADGQIVEQAATAHPVEGFTTSQIVGE
jgi:ABC-type lipoprotein export system ATPase subunit